MLSRKQRCLEDLHPIKQPSRWFAGQYHGNPQASLVQNIGVMDPHLATSNEHNNALQSPARAKLTKMLKEDVVVIILLACFAMSFWSLASRDGSPIKNSASRLNLLELLIPILNLRQSDPLPEMQQRIVVTWNCDAFYSCVCTHLSSTTVNPYAGAVSRRCGAQQICNKMSAAQHNFVCHLLPTKSATGALTM